MGKIADAGLRSNLALSKFSAFGYYSAPRLRCSAGGTMLYKPCLLSLRFFRAVGRHGARAALQGIGRWCGRRVADACGDMLPKLLEAQQRQISELNRVAEQHSQSIRWLAERLACAGQAQAAEVGTANVSVIMPVWNRAGAVGRAIASVRGQSYPHWDLWVIDDGSTDGTAAVVREFRDPRIHYLYQEHAGAAAARNRGLAHSRGEIIAYLDSDNIWYPGYLAAVAAAFRREPDRRSVYGALLFVDEPPGHAYVQAEEFAYARLRDGWNYIDMNAFAHRRDLYEERGGFDERLRRYLDWDLVLRYTVASAPLLLPVLAGRYEAGGNERITTREGARENLALLRSKHGLAAPAVPEFGAEDKSR